MIPAKLTLTNFMCYRAPTTLDFTGIHIACLSGGNGAGKSALLDAITWALWGKGRAKSDDDFISLGAREMEVDFEFELGDALYRVIRKRIKRKSGLGQSVLEFQVLDGESWRPLTGNTIHETQAKITSHLRMDYETFINSAFLLQGRADEFTIKRPGERKKILADILGLADYDKLEAAARESAREQDDRLRGLQALIQELDAQIARRSEIQEEINASGEQFAQISQKLRELEAVLQAAKERQSSLLAKREHLSQVEQAIERAESALRDARTTISAYESRLDDAQKLLSRADEITRGHEELKSARRQEAGLTTSLSALRTLNERASKLQRHIDEAAAKLRSEQEVIKHQMLRHQESAEREHSLRKQLDEIIDGLDKTKHLENELESLQEQLTACAKESHLLQAHNDTLRREMEELKRRKDMLGESSATCPLCKSDLGEEGCRHLEESIVADGKAKKEQYQDNAARIKNLEGDERRIKQEIANLQNDIKTRQRLQQQRAVLEKGIADALEAAQEAASCNVRLVHVLGKLDKKEYAQAEQRELAAVFEEIAKHSYDQETHEKLRRQISELEPYESLYSRLETAKSESEQLEKMLVLAKESEARSRTDLESDNALRKELLVQVAALPEVQKQVEELTDEVEVASVAFESAKSRLERAHLELAQLEEREIVRKEKIRLYDEAAQEKMIYTELAAAFGKKGIQAMIIESAIPEIEQEANNLLARMTDGRMNVKFETQRDTKAGDTIETLDIKLSDSAGTRSYELYSGGEAFRANFAIRIALSKLLAKRARAQLQTLVVDEGFGTQDEQGKERLVEAINSIQNEFDRILVVTHLQDLKDLFPVRIDVAKTQDGSEVSIC